MPAEVVELLIARARSGAEGHPSLGRHCHSTLPLTVIYGHCLRIHTVILLSLLLK